MGESLTRPAGRGREPPALLRNQFGGRLGGPMKKDELFFANYEGLRQTQVVTNQVTVPDDCAHQFLTSTTTPGVCGPPVPQHGTPFVTNPAVRQASFQQGCRADRVFQYHRDPYGTDWMVVTAIVHGPTYLVVDYITSTNLKREADGLKWMPLPCSAVAAVHVTFAVTARR